MNILDICSEIVKHIADLEVCSAVTGTLERTDSRRDRRINIRSRGRYRAADESGVITAAVLCVEYHTAVKEHCLIVCVAAVCAES